MITLTNEITSAKCLALGTFKRDGTLVMTPVWFHVTDGKILVTTKSSAAKIKRVRNNPHVTYAPCTQRGKVIGTVHHGQARILDEAASTRALADKKRRYFTQRILSILPGFNDQTALEITPQS